LDNKPVPLAEASASAGQSYLSLSIIRKCRQEGYSMEKNDGTINTNQIQRSGDHRDSFLYYISWR